MAGRRRGRRTQARPSARRLALRLTLVYVVAASLWIIFSDRVLGAFDLPIAVEREISSVKGLLFVAVTGLILWLLSARWLDGLRASEERYLRLFENSTEGLTVFRVVRDRQGQVEDLVVDDMNPTQSMRQHITRELAVGRHMGDCDPLDERMCAHFEFAAGAVHSAGPSRSELHISSDDAYELLLAFPIGRDLWALAALDVTEVRRAEQTLRREQEGIRQAYIDVLDAVTGGKLILLPEEALAGRLGEPLGPATLSPRPRELSEARTSHPRGRVVPVPRQDRPQVSVTPACEALTNALKHAGGGIYQVFALQDRIQVSVTDAGPGIDFRTLPRATLVRGLLERGQPGHGLLHHAAALRARAAEHRAGPHPGGAGGGGEGPVDVHRALIGLSRHACTATSDSPRDCSVSRILSSWASSAFAGSACSRGPSPSMALRTRSSRSGSRERHENATMRHAQVLLQAVDRLELAVAQVPREVTDHPVASFLPVMQLSVPGCLAGRVPEDDHRMRGSVVIIVFLFMGIFFSIFAVAAWLTGRRIGAMVLAVLAGVDIALGLQAIQRLSQ